jgi:hypothetical protein
LSSGKIPTLLENVTKHATQREFLTAVFPDVYPSLNDAEYNLLVGRRATRKYYGGQVDRLGSRYGTAYGFDVVVDSSSDAGELLTLEEVRAVFESLQDAFSLAPLVYHPGSPAARERAGSWPDPGFPIWMAPFRRGDATADGKVNLTDAISLLDRLFRGGADFLCQQAADTNVDGGLDISDAVYLLLYLFVGSQPVGQPLESCGWDLTPGSLPCVEFPPCEQ